MSDKYSWQQHQNERREERRKKAKPTIKKPIKRAPIKFKPKSGVKRLKRKTKKLSRAERIYSVLRKDFLLDNPVCQCGRPGCTGISTEVHHMKGRGKMLNVVDFFLAVCRSCHDWLEANPKLAKALGFSLNRIGPRDK